MLKLHIFKYYLIDDGQDCWLSCVSCMHAYNRDNERRVYVLYSATAQTTKIKDLRRMEKAVVMSEYRCTKSSRTYDTRMN